MRHGTVLHDYLAVTRAVDLDDLERQRMRYLAMASVPTTPTVIEAFVYLALQEMATRLAHANTARLIGDADGRRIMARIAADEHLHHSFYRDVVGAALDLDRSATVVAIDRQVRHFAMPGHEIPGFADRARAIAAAGIYSLPIFVEQVVEPLLIGAWRIESLTSLSDGAEGARDRVLRFVERMRLIAPRLAGVTSVEPVASAAPPGSS
jgi:acyl-[acyl-carrier-protein] desaturase